MAKLVAVAIASQAKLDEEGVVGGLLLAAEFAVEGVVTRAEGNHECASWIRCRSMGE
jgi:hypothetical protein